MPGPTPDPGSFKDPSGRVYLVADNAADAPDASGTRILRGLDEHAAAVMTRLLAEPFFQTMMRDDKVVATSQLNRDHPSAQRIVKQGWHSVLEHAPVAFISMPYEWCFSMLKDAALLTLHLLAQSIGNDWILKDATPFNIQYRGARPVFIDVPSFQPRAAFDYWRGYRQFSAMFLTPLLLDAHQGIAFQPLLRSRLEGIAPLEAINYFHGWRLMKRGVLAHVWLPARAEQRALRIGIGKGNGDTNSKRRQPGVALPALVDSLSRLITGLRHQPVRSDWSQYTQTHSYNAESYAQKKDFVERHAAAARPQLAWDLGANTGEFARLVAAHARTVIAADSDHDSIERLYQSLRAHGPDNITPLVMDLANPSPDQGWAGAERPAFAHRRRPDFILCLALLHHLRLTANIPLSLITHWLRSLNATIILEWISRDDTMFRALLANKSDDYADYTPANFHAELGRHFTIEERLPLKNGTRELFLLTPNR